jgi:type II secretory pathway pseudopilin PulG
VRRTQDDADEMIGQDSFLDVVTNIVGILILLVMVVGMRSSHAAKRESSEQSAADSAMRKQQQEELTAAYQNIAVSERDLRELLRRAANTRDESRLREQERALLSTMVAEADQEIAARRQKLSEQDKRDFDVRRKRAEAELALDELTREQVALVSQATVEEVECQPTPLSREVTGDETHILLADDHVAVVPFKELWELLREDAPKNFWRLKNEEVMERTIGPIGGFRLRYSFVLSNVVARSDAGTAVAGQFRQFRGCEFLPVTTPIGEPALEALRQGSEFQQHLQRLNPHRTTVTIWTYPGNFDRLRELRGAIREQGFQIALRPLPLDVPIGASPTGSKSAAE